MPPAPESSGLDDLFSVRGKVAVVTGATSGLGKRMAALLHEAGAHVTAAGRRAERLAELAALDGLHAVQADVSIDEDLVALLAESERRFGAVDILVNNAATIFEAVAQDETRENIETTLAVNLVAPFRLSQMAYKQMRAAGKGGSIINVTSIVAHVGMGGRLPQAGYAASKGGLLSLTRELAAQWARDGVRVNAIAPGFFHSEILDPILENERISDFIKRNSLIKRIGEPADFDGALLYLASEASSFVTGQTVHVDGGWSAR